MFDTLTASIVVFGAAGLVIILAVAVVYFVMPIDAVPDFIPGLGLLDDAALLGWALKTFQSDIDVFLAWEREQEEQP